ncbi:MAG: hypothetical protein MPJ22_00400 [Pirellulales bacterium]|nr:hypothetical protein [Alphaproteobacteria bacterium]MDA8040868.1 hypothetical protein [Pirellulales bacterium]
MRYLGLFTNVEDGDKITRIDPNEKIDRIFPSTEIGLISGEIRNESGFSSLIINFYSVRREIQEIVLAPNEAIDFTNLPCERLQVTVADQQLGEISYVVQLLSADSQEEVDQLLIYAQIKKKLHRITNKIFYPEIGSFVPNTIIADIFRRRMLNLPDHFPLYETATASGGLTEIENNTTLAVSHAGNVGSSAAASSFGAFHNSYFDPVVNINTIILESIIFDLDYQLEAGYEMGLFWNVDGAPWSTIVPGVKKFGFYKKPNNSNWFCHIDDIVSVADIDTGISLGSAPSILTRHILRATPAGSMLASVALIGNSEVAFEDERAFTLAPTEALFPNYYTRNDSRVGPNRAGIGSYGWSAEAR